MYITCMRFLCMYVKWEWETYLRVQLHIAYVYVCMYRRMYIHAATLVHVDTHTYVQYVRMLCCGHAAYCYSSPLCRVGVRLTSGK